MDAGATKKKVRLSELHEVKKILRSSCLHTVCEEALCPNIDECFSKHTATFMIMGDVCTRGCRFCNVKTGKPSALDSNEPERIALAAKTMGLKYVVVTSVTRDDLNDGGAAHFASTVNEIKKKIPDASVEVLTPDFKGDNFCIDIVLNSKPDIFNHNIETVERLSPLIRPQANYKRSLDVLRYAASKGARVKSGFMVGLGETEEEMHKTMRDIKEAGVNIITIGQYFNPAKKSSVPVEKRYSDDLFKSLETYGKNLGFDYVFSGVYVRSSYMAGEVFNS